MKGIALLIGLNRVNPAQYDGWSGKLPVCENDALVVEQYLKKFKYQTHTLLSKQATRANVLNGIDSAAKDLKSGDIFIMYYSGHGGQMPDVNSNKIVDGGDETDGLDETWCCYDGEIIDDIFFQRWFKFKAGVRIIVISDSCHSGSVIKNTVNGFERTTNEAFVTKQMPSEVSIRVFAKHEKEYRAFNKKETPLRVSKTKKISKADVKATVLLLGACQDGQLSQAQSFHYPDNSLFTAILLEIAGRKKSPTQYATLLKTIRSKMPADQQPNLMTLGKKTEILETQRPFKI
jgi:metacaspase-1